MKSVYLKLTSCKQCPHCDISRYYTANSWKYIQAWNCTHPDLRCAENDDTDHTPFNYPPGIGFEENGHKPERIPAWCPILRDKEVLIENDNKDNSKKPFKKTKKL